MDKNARLKYALSLKSKKLVNILLKSDVVYIHLVTAFHLVPYYNLCNDLVDEENDYE